MKQCSNCTKEVTRRTKAKSKRVFCNQKCYSDFRRDKLPFNEQHAYKGVLSETDPKWKYTVRYRKAHPEIISHLKARRYARERGAKGSHTLEQWEKLCWKFNWKCANCKKEKPLTKDHINPLSLGGTDYISNIQPLCRNCNSKKWKTFNIYENPELLK